MTPAARLQQAIEIVDLFLSTQKPADQVLHAYFRQRRFIGSSDRRHISEIVYQTFRQYFGLMNRLRIPFPQARLLVFGAALLTNQYTLASLMEILGKDKYAPEKLFENEIAHLDLLHQNHENFQAFERVSPWIYSYLTTSFPHTLELELNALDQQAPTDLRVNLLKTDRKTALKNLTLSGIEAEATPWSPLGIRLTKRQMLQDHPLWGRGEIEIQDEGSQIVSLLVEAKPGLQIFDYCAGAGGKTLAMAAMMANKGRILATDAVAWRLERSRERFKRSGVFNVECRILEETNRKWLKRQEGRYDRVLVDVPCSGSGTWRRNPDLKIRLTEQDFDEILQKQYHIMEQASWLVKPGGRLIYATCSILRRENHDQIAQFLAKHPEFKLLPIAPIWTEVIGKACPTSDLMLQLTPAQHQVDGFFAAVMERVV
jgi:16S rRNA (cytosine967-C5)-methyltransferase